MIDHLSLGVRDLAAARRFYDAFFAPLGAAVLSEKPAELGYGQAGVGPQFYLYPTDGERVAGLGAHTAFTAGSRLAADQAYAAAVAAGATVVRPVGEHPDIAPGYYGAVVLDPDGNKLEIVAAPMH
ncbi:VOC family protein [Phenylobacterium sp.]|uniref:VOC family protein n=1 Tax=Phenylobacterium sp. TaxID=1871053 RepID=UPI002C6380B8|nr:VOC family protein [Phenylobacterium sp.]HVI33113.1 VOC family protein [Phenylobacterium sp.]